MDFLRRVGDVVGDALVGSDSDSDGDSVDPFKTKSVSEIFGDSDSGDDTDDMIKKSAPITNRLQKKRPRLDSSSDESSEDEARKAERRKRKLACALMLYRMQHFLVNMQLYLIL